MNYIEIGLIGSLLLVILFFLTLKWYYWVKEKNRIEKKFISDFIYDNDDLRYIEDILISFHRKYDKLTNDEKDTIVINDLWNKVLKNFYK